MSDQGRLSQLEINYQPIEDRLLFKVHLQDFTQYKMWLTRRFTKTLWLALGHFRVHGMGSEEELEQEIKKQIAERFEKEQGMRQTDMAKRFGTEISRMPLDHTLLLAQIVVKTPKGSPPILCLHQAEGGGLELPMSPGLVHSMRKLIAESIRKTDWDLDISY